MSQRYRQQFLTDQVMTASPERLVTLLYDGLVANLGKAASAMAQGDNFATNAALVKAQAILLELQRSLKPELWDGGPGLLALYHYLYRTMIRANLTKDAGLVAECIRLVEPLQQAWHQAAAAATERTAVPAAV